GGDRLEEPGVGGVLGDVCLDVVVVVGEDLAHCRFLLSGGDGDDPAALRVLDGVQQVLAAAAVDGGDRHAELGGELPGRHLAGGGDVCPAGALAQAAEDLALDRAVPGLPRGLRDGVEVLGDLGDGRAGALGVRDEGGEPARVVLLAAGELVPGHRGAPFDTPNINPRVYEVQRLYAPGLKKLEPRPPLLPGRGGRTHPPPRRRRKTACSSSASISVSRGDRRL